MELVNAGLESQQEQEVPPLCAEAQQAGTGLGAGWQLSSLGVGGQRYRAASNGRKVTNWGMARGMSSSNCSGRRGTPSAQQ